MRLTARELQEKPREILVDEGLAAVVADALDGPVQRVSGVLRFSAEGDGVEVRGHVSAVAERVCERCGAPTLLQVETELELVYLPESTQGSEADVELGEDELALGWYADGGPQVEDVLSEALALAAPPRVQCEDRVACTERTRDLLAAQPRDADGPFAALGKLDFSG